MSSSLDSSAARVPFHRSASDFHAFVLSFSRAIAWRSDRAMAQDDGDAGVHVVGAHVWVRESRADSGWMGGEVLELLDEGKKLRVRLEDDQGRNGEVVERMADDCALHNPGRNVEVRLEGLDAKRCV